MSEMLANRYFYEGRFADAAPAFEALLRRHPGHMAARKKLVVCYIHTGRLQDALELTVGLLHENPRILADTRQDTEGFPCGSTLEAFRKREGAMTPVAFQTSLGLLQLFCNEQGAVETLARAADMDGVCGEVTTLRSLVLRQKETKDA